MRYRTAFHSVFTVRLCKNRWVKRFAVKIVVVRRPTGNRFRIIGNNCDFLIYYFGIDSRVRFKKSRHWLLSAGQHWSRILLITCTIKVTLKTIESSPNYKMIANTFTDFFLFFYAAYQISMHCIFHAFSASPWLTGKVHCNYHEQMQLLLCNLLFFLMLWIHWHRSLNIKHWSTFRCTYDNSWVLRGNVFSSASAIHSLHCLHCFFFFLTLIIWKVTSIRSNVRVLYFAMVFPVCTATHWNLHSVKA